MPQPRHLKAAPIVEGVIDIQLTTQSAPSMGAFRKLAEKFGIAHRIEEIHTMAFEMVQKPGMAPTQKSSSMGAVGFRCFSKDGRVIVQLRKDGFTFSRMAPYTSWEETFPQAAEIFTAYHGVVSPVAISRIAVRNINRLMLPALRLKESPAYFLSHPPLLPNSDVARTVKWMSRILVQHPVEKMEGIITQVVEDEAVGDKMPVILDVDVFDITALPLEPDELLPLFSRLREWKNRLFFDLLTEEGLKIFQ